MIGQFIPAFIGTEIFVSVSDFFVPLVSRFLNVMYELVLTFVIYLTT